MSVAAHKENHHHNAAQTLDWFGLGLSALCALHCIALPLLAGLMPVLEVVDQGGAFHWVMAVMIVPLGALAFWRGFRQHRKVHVLLTGTVGLVLVFVGLISNGLEHGHTQKLGTILTFVGSLFLILTHYQNYRLSRCQTCHSQQN